MAVTPTFSERLRSARRILFGRGDDAVACSFCGRDRLGGSDIVAGPSVAICGSCAHAALDSIWTQSAPPPRTGRRALGVIVSIAPVCLLPAVRQSLTADLDRIADELGCEVLGWSLTTGTRLDGDYLFVQLSRPDDETSPDLDDTFIRAVLSPRSDRAFVSEETSA